MGKVKYFNKTTQKWEYAETGGTPKRGVDYWLQQDQQPIYDYISKKVVDVTGQCRLTISLGSNQIDKSVLEGLAMSVTLPNGSVVTKYSGNTTSFTTGSVTVVFPNVAGYKKPDNFILSYKKGFVSKKFNYLGEVVTVNPLCDGVATDYTYTVTAENVVALTEGASLSAEVSGITQWLVPHGVTMTITPSSVDGYLSPIIKYVPLDVESSINVEWIYQPYGVFIADTTGRLWSTDDWDGSATADCVAVITSSCRFGIALTEASSTMGIHSSVSGELENYMTAKRYESSAKADYDGATNTTNIMKLQSGTSYAAGWCNAYTFPSGEKGFLPALGQWWAAYSNKSAVNAALTKAGGSALTSGTYYWASTFWGVDGSVSSRPRCCWALHWNGYVSGLYGLGADFQVRAFCSL